MTRQTLFELLQTALWGMGLLAVLAVNFLFYGNLTAQVICLVAGILIIGGWLATRGARQGQGQALPRTGMEIPLLAMLLGALASEAWSPAPRAGLERMAWFIFLSVLFYFLMDTAANPQFRLLERGVLVIMTWPVALMSLLSVYLQYTGWWKQVGSTQVMPPFPFRFGSIVGHANIYMGLVNLCAPVALVMFISTRSRVYRIISGLWLVTYAVTVPFSSSRGGWLGLAAWALALGVLWVADNGRWSRVAAWLRRRWPIATGLGVAALAVLAVAALKFYNVFAGANPTHGFGFALNREGIWGPAIQIWQSSPWIGSGLGQLSQRFMTIVPAFPTGWYAAHAHSVPLQILAEMGLVGFIPFIALTITAVALLVRGYRHTPPAERMWSAASIAALAGVFVHGIFEEFSGFPLFITIVMLHLAMVAGAAGPLPRMGRVRVTWLAAPALLALGVAVYSLWAYAPLFQAAPAGEAITDWKQAARSASLSADRDPAVPFFQSQAGIAWAMAWQATGDAQSLEQARVYSARAVKAAPENPIYRANLAVIDWQSGRSAEAMEAIQQAMQLSPTEPSFPLNYGWFLEQSGQTAQATAQYRRALELDPSAATNPFWQSTPLRQAASSNRVTVSASQSHWQAARDHFASRDYSTVRMDLALASVYGEPGLPIDTGWASLALAQGDTQSFYERLDTIKSELDYVYWGNARINDGYNYYYSRNFQRMVVPGYLRASADYGQFDLLSQERQMQTAAGDCQAAAQTWQVLQREQHAGELPKGGYPPPPACVDSSN